MGKLTDMQKEQSNMSIRHIKQKLQQAPQTTKKVARKTAKLIKGFYTPGIEDKIHLNKKEKVRFRIARTGITLAALLAAGSIGSTTASAIANTAVSGTSKLHELVQQYQLVGSSYMIDKKKEETLDLAQIKLLEFLYQGDTDKIEGHRIAYHHNFSENIYTISIEDTSYHPTTDFTFKSYRGPEQVKQNYPKNFLKYLDNLIDLQYDNNISNKKFEELITFFTNFNFENIRLEGKNIVVNDEKDLER